MISRGVQITMQNHKTLRARELSPTEGHILNNKATTTTSMAAPSCSWVLQALSTECDLFVGQHIYEWIPRSVSYAFSQPMVLKHTLNIQFFNSNSRKSDSQTSAQFMQEVTPLVSNLQMLLCQPESCFSSVVRAFDLFAQPSLQELDSFFSFNQVSGISYNFTIAKSSEVFQTNINPYLLTGRMNNRSIRHFTAKDSKPLPYLVLLDGKCFNLAFRGTMQDNRHISNLAEFEPFVRQNLKSTLRKSDAVYPALEARKSLLFTGLVLNPAKEVGKCLIHSVRDVLLGLGMNIKVFSSKILVAVKTAKRHFAILPRVYIQCKKLIVDCLASFERINDSYLLSARRVYPKFVHPEFHSKVIL